MLTPVAAVPLDIENPSALSPTATTARAALAPVETALLLSKVGGKLHRAELRHRHEVAKAWRARKRKLASDSTASPQLEAIAQCESHGDPRAIGGGGQYRGKFQMTYSSWAAVGGKGDPAAAPEAEQNARAAKLLAQSGAGQWPVCGT